MDYMKETFKEYILIGINIENFDDLLSEKFNLPATALPKYRAGLALPHPSVIEKIIDWIENEPSFKNYFKEIS